MQCDAIFNEDENYDPDEDHHECRLERGHIANGLGLEHKCHCGFMWFNNRQVHTTDVSDEAPSELRQRIEALEARVAELEKPRSYIPPAADPISVLRGTCCEHVAAQHGYQFNWKDGSVRIGGACSECDCTEFRQDLPWHTTASL